MLLLTISFWLLAEKPYKSSIKTPKMRTWELQWADKFDLDGSVGGNWGGRQGVDGSVFPATMQVDYVRYYTLAHRKK